MSSAMLDACVAAGIGETDELDWRRALPGEKNLATRHFVNDVWLLEGAKRAGGWRRGARWVPLQITDCPAEVLAPSCRRLATIDYSTAAPNATTDAAHRSAQLRRLACNFRIEPCNSGVMSTWAASRTARRCRAVARIRQSGTSLRRSAWAIR